MNVLIIAQYFPPDLGGGPTRAYNVAKALVSQGSSVTVLTSFPHYPYGNIPPEYRNRLVSCECHEEIKIIRTWIPALSHFSNINRLILHSMFMMSCFLGMFYITKCDVIFAMNPNLISSFPALMFKLRFKKKIIRNVDDLWPEVFYDLGMVKSRLLRYILDHLSKFTYKIAARVMPVSSGYVEVLVDKYKISPSKIVVIEHGVDVSNFKVLPSLHKHKNKKIVMYSGALNVGYDFKLIIEAAQILRSEPLLFLIRGFGERVNEIRQLISDYELKNVYLLSQNLSKKDLVSLLNAADIFLLPMSSTVAGDRGLPTKVLEYQALGKPIICISDGEAARYILQTKSGLVTKDRSPQEVANLIMNIAKDEELAKSLGKNGYNNIMNNLTLEKIGLKILNTIEKLK